MQKIVFLLNPIGSEGDVHPFLAVGQGLSELGHDAVILTNPVYQKRIEQLDLEFVSIGSRDSLRIVGKDPRIHQQRHAWKLALHWGATGTMRETFEQIKRLSQQRLTVVVSSPLSFGARIACESLGIKLATMLVDPDKLRSVVRSPVLPPLVLHDWVPATAKRLQFYVADRFFIDPIVAPEANRFRSELALPPIKRLLHHWWLSSDLIIGLWDPIFAPPQSDWPPHVQLTGPTLWDPPRSDDRTPQVESFLDAGSAPILFVPGSAGTGSQHFLAVAMQSCLKLERRGIFLTKRRRELPNNLPNTIQHFDYIPLRSVLPRCAAIVHHGGTGTAAQAMAAGIPQLTCPIAFNHRDIAARLEKLEIGCTVPKSRFTVNNVTRQLRKLLNEDSIKSNCTAVAKKLEKREPVKKICHLLEQLAQSSMGQKSGPKKDMGNSVRRD